jgi:dihydropyrimidine dehydrogenase (NAD+) subunit PreT
MSAGLQNPDIAHRFPDLHPAFTPQEAAVESNRCLFCFDAPCAGACPTHIDVPRFIKKIASGNLRGSAVTILDANILGASCARVCPVDVLCEGACVMHQYNRQPIEIGRLQRHAMEHFYRSGASLPVPGFRANAARVACIGAGPASLACAAELRKLGHAVTLFDSRPLPGGLNTYGVAEYKLRAADSLREVELVRALGVEFRMGVEVGTGISIDELEQSFDAIFIGAGLGYMEALGIPGENLPGVVDALRFIGDYKTAQSIPVRDTVAVIGAGNTAIDAANAAKRLGAKTVYLIYRRGEEEMPAFRFEYDHALREGIQFLWQVQPVAILPCSNGYVASLECQRMELGERDASGRRAPAPIPDSNFRMAVDMVIPAIGQSRLLSLVERVNGIALKGGCVVIDRATGRTGNPRYYAGGDCVNGGREVVDAVADGKRAAHGIASYVEAGRG